MAEWWFLVAILSITILQASATVTEEVQVLNDLYRSLNSPRHLRHWTIEGGNPCKNKWFGVSCYGSSVLELDLHGMNLSGTLGCNFTNLKNLEYLDLSSNNVEGPIPYSLPPLVTNLNLSHNSLSGSLEEAFSEVGNMREMDLSFNSFTGDLPTSFRTLTNLTSLLLQNNQFTGSVDFLANLPLVTLNIKDNHFCGVIPRSFQRIHNLWTEGNKFGEMVNCQTYRPPKSSMPIDQNIRRPSTAIYIGLIFVFVLLILGSATSVICKNRAKEGSSSSLLPVRTFKERRALKNIFGKKFP